MRKVLLYAGSYAIAATLWFAFFWFQESDDRRLGGILSNRGVVTSAHVTESFPNQHNTICFTYTVNGSDHYGCDFAHFGASAAQLPPGSSTSVTYSADDPNVYCACSADSLVRNAREAPFVGALFGVLLWTALLAGLHRSRIMPR